MLDQHRQGGAGGEAQPVEGQGERYLEEPHCSACQALERKDQLEEEKDKILALLFKAQGALLDDEDLIGGVR